MKQQPRTGAATGGGDSILDRRVLLRNTKVARRTLPERANGMFKIQQGLTTVEEVLRVTEATI